MMRVQIGSKDRGQGDSGGIRRGQYLLLLLGCADAVVHTRLEYAGPGYTVATNLKSASPDTAGELAIALTKVLGDVFCDNRPNLVTGCLAKETGALELE